MFDVDCDPRAVAAGLAALEEAVPGAVREGTRLPGCFDPFETACRAVLGRQVSVVAANRLAARIVNTCPRGGCPELNRRPRGGCSAEKAYRLIGLPG